MRTYIKNLSQHKEEEVTIKGWVHVARNQGKMAFFDFRDMTGIVQGVVFGKPEVLEIAAQLRPEWVVAVTGKVNERPEKMRKEGVMNGDIELEITGIEVLNTAETPVFDITEDTKGINEETRLKHRYLDLRTERMQKNMRLRSKLVQSMREFLIGQDFTEVETPMLAAPTKEGSRDFVVPSRVQKGKFYALPQSPQQYKQLLMVGGMERYFQIARAMRDEDLRADRSFEHTQIDLEMSFIEQSDVIDLVEAMVIHGVESLGGTVKEKPFPRVTYKESMEKYGDDKFDLRTEEDKENGVLAFAWVVDFPMFKKVDTEDVAEMRDGKSGWTFTHNPFSMPAADDLEKHLGKTDIESIGTQQYDLVCNGFEAGGGSIRAHKADILRSTYQIMGYTNEEIETSVGHMLKAFDYGTPPHGGIALGLDRMVMLLTGEENLREVQAFPMTRSGNTAVMDAPVAIDEQQLEDFGIILRKKKEDK